MNVLSGALLSIALALTTAQSPNEAANAKTIVQLEFKIYRVLTNITGNGLTSQTLPGLPGSFQILHEKWAGVKVSMDKYGLTWNGQPAPKHPQILDLGRPRITVLDGHEAQVSIVDPVQYFQPESNGSYSLHHDAGAGLTISVLPRLQDAQDENRIELHVNFKVKYVTSRDPLPEVDLNVGKPNFETTALEGNIGAYNNQWACFRTGIPSQGHVYVFIKPSTNAPPRSGN